MANSTGADFSAQNQTEGGKCVELALEGEKRCRKGETKAGISFLEAALAAGTDDLRTLSAIYSQLGNAYFYLGDYLKALEYHRHDLTLARTIGDRLGEAKASGNLGNTLKVLGKFEEAILCCRRHLEISQELSDKIGEGRAYYNLGNVYHAKGKHIGRLMNSSCDTSAEFPQEVKISLLSAVEFYEANLGVVEELGDRAAQGRACGNLGNTHYLLGQFDKAIHYHNQRLNIAKEFGDKPAMRRAYSNLGNAHVFLGEFELAADYYRKAFAIALELGDKATEAQACYSLGNTATLMGEHLQAVDYHLRHLRIARQLDDRVGQARAAWSLGNAYTALEQNHRALYFVMVHLHLSREIGDTNGETVAEGNLTELSAILGTGANPDDSADPTPIPIDELVRETGIGDKSAALDKVRRRSMDHMELWRLTPDRRAGGGKDKKLDHPQSLSTQENTSTVSQIRPLLSGNTPEEVFDEDSFFDLLSKVQGKRINDQRCDASTLTDNKENRPRVRATDGFRQSLPAPDQTPEEFLEMITTYQSRRMDDQRASLPFLPGLQNPARVLGPHLVKKKAQHNGEAAKNRTAINEAAKESTGAQASSAQHKMMSKSKSVDIGATGSRKQEKTKGIDEDFYDMLIKCQSTRIEEQRSELPRMPSVKPAPTVPDEDFFQLIMRLQARRCDEQRASLSPSAMKNSSSAPLASSGSGKDHEEQQKPPKRTASQKIKKR